MLLMYTRSHAILIGQRKHQLTFHYTVTSLTVTYSHSRHADGWITHRYPNVLMQVHNHASTTSGQYNLVGTGIEYCQRLNHKLSDTHSLPAVAVVVYQHIELLGLKDDSLLCQFYGFMSTSWSPKLHHPVLIDVRLTISEWLYTVGVLYTVCVWRYNTLSGSVLKGINDGGKSSRSCLLSIQ